MEAPVCPTLRVFVVETQFREKSVSYEVHVYVRGTRIVESRQTTKQFEKKQKLSQSNQLTIIEKSSQKKFFFGLNEALYLLDSINFKFSLTKFSNLQTRSISRDFN